MLNFNDFTHLTPEQEFVLLTEAYSSIEDSADRYNVLCAVLEAAAEANGSEGEADE